MTARDIPNIITLLRIVLVIPTTVLLVDERYAAALVLFAGLGASDGLDGFLARRFGWTTRLGALLDPIADKTMLISSFVALAWNGLLPLWLVVLVVGRDALIVGGAIAYRLLFGTIEMDPTLLSKVNTFLQIALVLAVVFAAGVAPLPAVLRDGLMVLVSATTLVSGTHYVRVWSRKALLHRRGAS